MAELVDYYMTNADLADLNLRQTEAGAEPYKNTRNVTAALAPPPVTRTFAAPEAPPDPNPDPEPEPESSSPA